MSEGVLHDCVLFWQRHWPLVDRRVPAAPPAGQQQMHPDHEDGAVGDAVDHLPQPEIQYQQSDRYTVATVHAVMFVDEQVKQWDVRIRH